ncbi:DUF1232 domain-containing protein [Parabacteroides faecis]|uniref:YkvA family protein n=1 Tax=Parabacteroides TaxID=375288 RepID=UPI001654D914|nr:MULTISPECIES: DUF1232 domain-containing protein [Parabacteroides]MBC8619303.1 DUF1232 domain-containing protein [Parabacteroides faecis]
MMEKRSIINYFMLWEKIDEYTRKAGRVSARPVLLLYYVLKSPDTPKSDKLLIVSALSYLVLPIDLISAKRLPVIGWIDEIVSLTIAYQKVCKYITPEIQWKVDNILDRWFPEIESEVLTN